MVFHGRESKSFLTTIILLCCVCSVSAKLLPGGNFDIDSTTSKWDFVLNEGAEGKGQMSFDSSEGHEKPGSIKVVNNSKKGHFCLYHLSGKKLKFDDFGKDVSGYTLSAWVKTTDYANIWLELSFYLEENDPSLVWFVNSVDYMAQTPPIDYNSRAVEGQWRKIMIKFPTHKYQPDIIARYFTLVIRGEGIGTTWIDDIVIEPYNVEPIRKLALSSYHTDLKDSDGNAKAVVLIPTDKNEASQAKSLAKALKLPTITEPELESPFPAYPVNGINPETNLILVSSGKGGPLTCAMRRALMIRENERIPGQEGYTVRTIARPFRSTANVIAICGGDLNGLKAGIREFKNDVKKNKGLYYDRFLNTKPGMEWAKALSKSKWFYAEAGDPYFEQVRNERYSLCRGRIPTWRWFGRTFALFAMQVADRYYMTGNMEYAKIYKEHIINKAYPRREGHMGLHALMRSWDIMEESGVFSDEERLDMTNYLLYCMDSKEGYGVRMVFNAAHYTHPVRFRHNHWMVASNGLLAGYMYFDRLYGLERAKEWKAWVDDVALNAAAWGGMEDSAHYQVRMFSEAARYWRWQGLSSYNQPGTEFFRDFAKLTFAIRDNLGLLSNFGDGSFIGTFYLPTGTVVGDSFDQNNYHDHEMEFLLYMAEDWGLQQPVQYYIDHVVRQRTVLKVAGYEPGKGEIPPAYGHYDAGADPTQPEFRYQFGSAAVGGPKWAPAPSPMPKEMQQLTGLNVLRKKPEYYDWRAGFIPWQNTFYFPLFRPLWVPAYSNVFDKISYRSGWDADDEYLLIDGIGMEMDHGHWDLGNFTRYVNKGHVWVTDQSYNNNAPMYHNVPEIFNDGYPLKDTPYGSVHYRQYWDNHWYNWPAMAELLDYSPKVPEKTGEFNVAFKVEHIYGTNAMWTRQFKGGGGKPLELIDTIEAMEDGEYNIVWRINLVGNSVTGKGGAWLVLQNGAEMPVALNIERADKISSASYPEIRGDGGGCAQYYWYPYVDHINPPTTLEWSRSKQLKKGQKMVFQAVLGPVELTNEN